MMRFLAATYTLAACMLVFSYTLSVRLGLALCLTIFAIVLFLTDSKQSPPRP